jgi:HPr kinase/phosphorylase
MDYFKHIKPIIRDSIPVYALLKSSAKLESLTNDVGMNNNISDKILSRPQLALAGNFSFFYYKPIQIFGNTEYFYLKSLTQQQKIKAFKELSQFPIPCIIITNNHSIDNEMLDIAKNNNIAVLRTEYDTTKTTYILAEFLDDLFAPHAVVHGSFIDVHGVGVLFAGRSGIGKSEIALDLIERGHRFVADDAVMVTRKGDQVLIGTSTSTSQQFMEIRGLGIVDIRQMFGIRSVRFQKRLEIIVELEEWKDPEQYTRTGLDEEPISLLGVEITRVKLPIFPGKNITVIAEVIAINYLLRTYGYNAAKEFSTKQQIIMHSRLKNEHKFQDMRFITSFQHDIE